MQQLTVQPEERYADGLGEYSSFYGGPSYEYLAPAKSATSTVQELSATPPSVKDMGRQSASSNLQHAISYDLAANNPTFRREAEGLQIAYHQSNHNVPATYYASRQGYSKEAEGLQSVSQNISSGYAPHSQDNMLNTRHHDALTGYPMPAAVPAPLNYSQKSPASDFYLHQFPQPPTSPTSEQHIHPAFRNPASQQQRPETSSIPQPLKFKRANTLPPTPPQSLGGRPDEDTLRHNMQTLTLGNATPTFANYASGPTRFVPGALPRMNTMGSLSSERSSSTPGSPFDQHHRISVAQPKANIRDIVEIGPPEMTSTEAHAEVLQMLDKADKGASQKSSGGVLKKGFSLKRSNTTKPVGSTSHSQDALTAILEDVAEEGSLPMVKAIISLGADPAYRSASKLKKVKHEALAKATANGHAKVVDFLLQKGATYGEAQKKSAFTPTDRALLTTVYRGHAELAVALLCNHGANPMIEQWPREMEDTQHYWAESQVRLSKTSVLDGVSHWKNEEQGLSVLRLIMQNPKFDPAAPVSGVFDNKSELQSAEFGHRPWQTTYEYSALACFVRAGWADAVEEMLSIKSSPAEYEKEDEVLQYQDKVTRFISPVNALTKDTWDQRPSEALRLLRLLIERGFNIGLAQRTANDLGPRTPLARALSANASQAVELIAQSRPELVKEVISFRRNKKETKAQPLAAALALEKLDTARVLLRAGAHPRDPAFDMNALHFAAHQGGETGTAMLAEMLPLAPELTYSALSIAIQRTNKDCVRVLLDSISAAATRNQILALPAIWDMLLPIPSSSTSSSPDSQSAYLDLIAMVHVWDAEGVLPRPQLPAILAAIKQDNYVGVEKMLQLGVLDGRSLVLNCKARPLGDGEEECTVLEAAEATGRSADWLGLVRGWGARLYT